MQTFLTPAEIKIIREQEVLAHREGYGLSTNEKGESSGTGPDPSDAQAPVIIPPAVITQSATDVIPPPVTEATGLELVPVTPQEYNPDNPGFATTSTSTGKYSNCEARTITFR